MHVTVIGMLANLLRISSQQDSHFQDLLRLRIAIAGTFESRVTEYIWFRNLAVSAHVGRFGNPSRREMEGRPEHPGGQSPVRVDVLENATFWMVFAHENLPFLEKLHRTFTHPHPQDVLHLGRAEDWVIIELVGDMRPVRDLVAVDRYGGATPCFHWIPREDALWIPEVEGITIPPWGDLGGLLYRLGTYYRIIDGRRVFYTTEVKLVEGNWPPGTPRLVLTSPETAIRGDAAPRIPVWFWQAPEEVVQAFQPGESE
ncbi:MAG: hypothetical protein L3J76_03520, partial [Candidatus Hydrothermae bacterium]|nr:hypothetical protein [Candidatus Hydrothermae bacterium]